MTLGIRLCDRKNILNLFFMPMPCNMTQGSGHGDPKHLNLFFMARPCNMTQGNGLCDPKTFKIYFYAPAMQHDAG
jgi:hypothetical protein